MENIGNNPDVNGIRGIIFDIKEFAVHDGAGVRTTVFLKGCPLRCTWCHNPEGQSAKPELMEKSGCVKCGRCKLGCSHPECQPFKRCLHSCPKGLLKVAGREVTSSETAEKLCRDAELYELSGGGVTLSGGEPLMQHSFCLDLLRRLGKAGINRAIETCAYAPEDVFRSVISECDFVYCDLKLSDSMTHQKYTGVPNGLILNNIEVLRTSGVPYRLRVPLIPGITDTEENLAGIKKLASPEEVQYLPYNKLAGAKYAMLGRKFPLEK
ncbi:MAG: glycyl-radical enzyme activating protein [Eubacteriales bacterium]